MNEFEKDIERRLKEVKKREDDIAKREREYDRKEKEQNNISTSLDAQFKDIRVQRLTILNATEQEVKEFEEFKKNKVLYKNIIEAYNRKSSSVEQIKGKLEGKIRYVQSLERTNEALQKQLLTREQGIKKKENLISSKEEVIKVREHEYSKELIDKMVKISAQSEAIKKDIQDFKDKVVLKEGEFNFKERDISIALEKIQAMESDFKKKMESVSIVTIDLNNLAERLNSKEIELMGREGRIIVIENNIEGTKKEAENFLKEAREMSIEADNQLNEAEEKRSSANQTLLNIKEKEKVTINKVEKLEAELASVNETNKSIKAYKEKLDKDASINEENRLRLAREQGDVNRKLKAIEDYEKKRGTKWKE